MRFFKTIVSNKVGVLTKFIGLLNFFKEFGCDIVAKILPEIQKYLYNLLSITYKSLLFTYIIKNLLIGFT